MSATKLKVREEQLLEACHTGDEIKVQALLEAGVNVNAAHPMNGWTALHWAVKRNHNRIARVLLEHGADKTVKDAAGNQPAAFAKSSKEILGLLEAPDSQSERAEVAHDEAGDDGGFVPNYLRHPQFFYATDNRPKKIEEKKLSEDTQTASQAESNVTPQSTVRHAMVGSQPILQELASLRLEMIQILSNKNTSKDGNEEFDCFDVHVHAGETVHRIVGVHKDTLISTILDTIPLPVLKMEKAPKFRLYADRQNGLVIPSQACGHLHKYMTRKSGQENQEGTHPPLVLYLGMG
eukprot:m.76966 g.76966  ORF g.76966 m.76966 type:complete len:293 (+) comp12593_c1_seq1:115-993(+)